MALLLRLPVILFLFPLLLGAQGVESVVQTEAQLQFASVPGEPAPPGVPAVPVSPVAPSLPMM